MNEGLARGMSKGGGKKMGATLIAKIVGELFAARNYAHRAHLKTPDFSKHKALNEFYDEIVDLADSLAEGAQGVWGLLDIPSIELKGSVDDPIMVLSNHIDLLSSIAEDCDKAFLQNIFQEIEALYYSTLYKLKELS